MNSNQAPINDEFVETAYATEQVDQARTTELLLGINFHCSFLNSDTPSVPLTRLSKSLTKSFFDHE